MPNVYLVGFMGSGKSTLARCLADKLALAVIDLDSVVSEDFGAPISRIFAEHGEAVFREAEHRALTRIVKGEEAVVALGGGTFCSAANRQLIEAMEGVSVFIDVPWETIARRLPNGDVSRPVFVGHAEARELYASRRRDYELATLTVALDGSESPPEIARLVQGMLTEVACAT